MMDQNMKTNGEDFFTTAMNLTGLNGAELLETLGELNRAGLISCELVGTGEDERLQITVPKPDPDDSFEVPRAIFEHAEQGIISPNDMVVYTILVGESWGNNGVGKTSPKQLSAIRGLSLFEARHALRTLLEGEYILRESADDADGTFAYRINFEKFAEKQEEAA